MSAFVREQTTVTSQLAAPRVLGANSMLLVHATLLLNNTNLLSQAALDPFMCIIALVQFFKSLMSSLRPSLPTSACSAGICWQALIE